MNIRHRSLEDSLQGTDTVLVSGKGGVGKSTIAAALALREAQHGKSTQLVDLDSAHSSLDTFGLPLEETHEAEMHNGIREVAKNLRVLLLTSLIRDPRDIDDLNEQLERFVPNEGVLPILRLAVHSRFFGIPSEHKPMAHVLQLVELLQHQRFYVCDYRDEHEGVTPVAVPYPDRTIIDSENTQGLTTVIRSLEYLERSLLNVQDRMEGSLLNPSNLGFQITVGRQPNIKAYAQSVVGHNPHHAIAVMRTFCEHMRSARTAIAIVTNPGRNEVNQTVREVEELVSGGTGVRHILMNRWPEQDSLQESALHWEQQLIEKLQRFPHTSSRQIGYSRVACGPLESVDPGNGSARETCMRNLEKIAKTFTSE